MNLLKACSRLAAWNQGRKVHIAIVEGGFQLDLFVGSVLIDMYGKCGAIHDAYRAFSTMSQRDVVMWNAMLCTCSYYGSPDDVFSLYHIMLDEYICCQMLSHLLALLEPVLAYYLLIMADQSTYVSVDMVWIEKYWSEIHSLTCI